ncbi:hypothetical protein TYRP_017349 [Tyrophagus putrescentiae]|nr:hypothetical protein TYRP_017349 [Tyrophagus putrescentiae]
MSRFWQKSCLKFKSSSASAATVAEVKEAAKAAKASAVSSPLLNLNCRTLFFPDPNSLGFYFFRTPSLSLPFSLNTNVNNASINVIFGSLRRRRLCSCSSSSCSSSTTAGRGRRVSKAKLPANEIVPGPIAPPGHPNFVQHTTAVKKVSTTSKRGTASSSSTANVKTTLAVSGSDHVEKGSDKSKGGGGPHISVSITNKLVSLRGKVKEGKSPESLLKSYAEEVEEDEEKWEEAAEAEETAAATSADAQTVPKTVIETSKQKAAPEPTEPFQLLYDPELPSSAEGLKQHFVDNIADSLEDNQKARALCEHLLAMLKLSE